MREELGGALEAGAGDESNHAWQERGMSPTMREACLEPARQFPGLSSARTVFAQPPPAGPVCHTCAAGIALQAAPPTPAEPSPQYSNDRPLPLLPAHPAARFDNLTIRQAQSARGLHRQSQYSRLEPASGARSAWVN